MTDTGQNYDTIEQNNNVALSNARTNWELNNRTNVVNGVLPRQRNQIATRNVMSARSTRRMETRNRVKDQQKAKDFEEFSNLAKQRSALFEELTPEKKELLYDLANENYEIKDEEQARKMFGVRGHRNDPTFFLDLYNWIRDYINQKKNPQPEVNSEVPQQEQVQTQEQNLEQVQDQAREQTEQAQDNVQDQQQPISAPQDQTEEETRQVPEQFTEQVAQVPETEQDTIQNSTEDIPEPVPQTDPEFIGPTQTNRPKNYEEVQHLFQRKPQVESQHVLDPLPEEEDEEEEEEEEKKEPERVPEKEIDPSLIKTKPKSTKMSDFVTDFDPDSYDYLSNPHHIPFRSKAKMYNKAHPDEYVIATNLNDKSNRDTRQFHRPTYSPKPNAYQIDIMFTAENASAPETPEDEAGKTPKTIDYLVMINVNTRYLMVSQIAKKETRDIMFAINGFIVKHGIVIDYLNGDRESGFVGMKNLLEAFWEERENNKKDPPSPPAGLEALYDHEFVMRFEKNDFTFHNKLVDSVIRTIRDAAGLNPHVLRDENMVQHIVNFYNKTPHTGLLKKDEDLYYTPIEMQNNPDLEWEYIRSKDRELTKTLKQIKGAGYFEYKRGDILRIHLDYAKTPKKLRKRRMVYQHIGIFDSYVNGNVRAFILGDNQFCEVPIFYTQKIGSSLSDVPDAYRFYYKIRQKIDESKEDKTNRAILESLLGEDTDFVYDTKKEGKYVVPGENGDDEIHPEEEKPSPLPETSEELVFEEPSEEEKPIPNEDLKLEPEYETMAEKVYDDLSDIDAFKGNDLDNDYVSVLGTDGDPSQNLP